MSEIDDIIFIARRMRTTWGEEALSVMEERAITNHLDEDREGARVWYGIALAIRALDETEQPPR